MKYNRNKFSYIRNTSDNNVLATGVSTHNCTIIK